MRAMSMPFEPWLLSVSDPWPAVTASTGAVTGQVYLVQSDSQGKFIASMLHRTPFSSTCVTACLAIYPRSIYECF